MVLCGDRSGNISYFDFPMTSLSGTLDVTESHAKRMHLMQPTSENVNADGVGAGGVGAGDAGVDDVDGGDVGGGGVGTGAGAVRTYAPSATVNAHKKQSVTSVIVRLLIDSAIIRVISHGDIKGCSCYATDEND